LALSDSVTTFVTFHFASFQLYVTHRFLPLLNSKQALLDFCQSTREYDFNSRSESGFELFDNGFGLREYIKSRVLRSMLEVTELPSLDSSKASTTFPSTQQERLANVLPFQQAILL